MVDSESRSADKWAFLLILIFVGGMLVIALHGGMAHGLLTRGLLIT